MKRYAVRCKWRTCCTAHTMLLQYCASALSGHNRNLEARASTNRLTLPETVPCAQVRRIRAFRIGQLCKYLCMSMLLPLWCTQLLPKGRPLRQYDVYFSVCISGRGSCILPIAGRMMMSLIRESEQNRDFGVAASRWWRLCGIDTTAPPNEHVTGHVSRSIVLWVWLSAEFIRDYTKYTRRAVPRSILAENTFVRNIRMRCTSAL